MKFLPKLSHAFKQRRVIRGKVWISRSGGAKRPRFELQLSDLYDCGISKLNEQIPESVYSLSELFDIFVVRHPGSLSPGPNLLNCFLRPLFRCACSVPPRFLFQNGFFRHAEHLADGIVKPFGV